MVGSSAPAETSLNTYGEEERKYSGDLQNAILASGADHWPRTIHDKPAHDVSMPSSWAKLSSDALVSGFKRRLVRASLLQSSCWAPIRAYYSTSSTTCKR